MKLFVENKDLGLGLEGKCETFSTSLGLRVDLLFLYLMWTLSWWRGHGAGSQEQTHDLLERSRLLIEIPQEEELKPVPEDGQVWTDLLILSCYHGNIRQGIHSRGEINRMCVHVCVFTSIIRCLRVCMVFSLNSFTPFFSAVSHTHLMSDSHCITSLDQWTSYMHTQTNQTWSLQL